MQLTPKRRLLFPLLCLWTLTASPRDVPSAGATPLDFDALARQCMGAQTPVQCHPALLACEQLAVMLKKEPPSPDLDRFMFKFWSEFAWCEDKLGKYSDAEAHDRQALAIVHKVYGSEHPEVAASLKNLGAMLDLQGKYKEAEPLYRQALTMRQKLLGPEHQAIAESLDGLASVLDSQSVYPEAAALFRQSLKMNQKLFGPENLAVATSLNGLAKVLDHQGMYTEAEQLFRQALTMRQKLLRVENSEVEQSMNNLAFVLDHQGKYAQAEQIFRQVLEMMKKVVGTEHPNFALVVNNLAFELSRQGRYNESELLFRQALLLRQKLLDPHHPEVASSLNNLAVVLDRQGKYAEAEEFDRQALQLIATGLGKKHLYYAHGLSNLASVFVNQGRYAQAEPLYRESLTTLQKILGLEHPEIASNLNNLASVIDRQGRYAEAEGLHRKALAMRQKLLGPEHPDVAMSLNNLASVLGYLGKAGEAEPIQRQALALCRKLLGAEHPDLATNLDNLASLLRVQGKRAAAMESLSEAARIREGQLRVTTSETRTQALLDSIRPEEDVLYGLLLEEDTDPKISQLALTTALLRKGRALEAGASANRLLHHNLTDPALRQQFEQWQAVRQQREALLYRGLESLTPPLYQAQLTNLKLQAESLEAQLSAKLPQNLQLQPPGFDAMITAVAQRLPKTAVLVEVVWARPFRATKGARLSVGAPHYIAMLLSPTFPARRIVSLDLGLAATIDARTRELLAKLQNPSSNPKAAAQELYKTILKPLLPHLAPATDLYLSLDGTLNLVPFDALYDDADYLLGRYRFHYLTSGRDLLRTSSSAPTHSPLLLANPDFGKPEKVPSTDRQQSLYQQLAGLLPLPGTQREADMIGPLLGVVPLVGTRASEAAVRSAHAPQLLHIATHGLYLRDVDQPIPDKLESVLRSFLPRDPARSKNVAAPVAEQLPGETGAMNRSALALAGVLQGQHASSTTQDGLLTAEEARSLDLDGTQLVTLSACETGQGELSAGQGVYGLRRAFLIAGAETLVTSLWRVSDDATGELMTLYYRKLLDRQHPSDRLEAMVEAMKELRSRPDGGRAHPYYWAPFLVIGQNGPLRPLGAAGHQLR